MARDYHLVPFCASRRVKPSHGPWMVLSIGITVAILLLTNAAHARDLGQWAKNDPNVSKWFRNLMQPDSVPPRSCCGEADAYWADEVQVGANGETVAVITDNRPDAPLMRMHEDVGTRYVIPPNKITRKDGNPTGHVLLFLGAITWGNGKNNDKRPVLCYVMNGGV